MAIDALQSTLRAVFRSLNASTALKNKGASVYLQAPENAQFPYIHVLALDSRPLSRRWHSASQTIAITLDIVWRAESIKPGLDIYEDVLTALTPENGKILTEDNFTIYIRPEFTEHVTLGDGETQMLRCRFRVLAMSPCT